MHDMKECIRVKKLLSRYIDKEIGRSDTVLVEGHLDICSFCKKELRELSRVKELVLEKERKVLPQNYLVCRLRQKIVGEQRMVKQGLSWLTGLEDFSRKVIPIPVTVIVLSTVFLMLSSRRQLSESSLEEHLLSGAQTTTETALGLMLAARD
jgi:predicted anti-sigma-YlaC factor YlaD